MKDKTIFPIRTKILDESKRQKYQLARLLLGFGSGNRIDRTVRFVAPKNITIGSNCELREHVLLDARSERRPSILIGDGCRIKAFTSLMTYGGKIEVGNQVLIGQGTRIFGHNGISIGDYSMIGGGVSIQSLKHLSYESEVPFQYQGFLKMPPIVIESNVAIGDNSVIMPGVTIKRNVHVGAGSVVTKNLESGYFYVGIPARKKKALPRKPTDDQIFQLERLGSKITQRDV